MNQFIRRKIFCSFSLTYKIVKFRREYRGERKKREKTRFILMKELINVENNAYRKTSSGVVFILFYFIFLLLLLFCNKSVFSVASERQLCQ